MAKRNLSKKKANSSIAQDVITRINQALNAAIQQYQAGNVQSASQLYRQILQVDPDNADANHMLGVIAYQSGNNTLAEQLIRKAIQAKPSMVQAYNNLGAVLKELDKLEDAKKIYQKVTKLKPDYAEGYCNLGIILKELGQTEEAITSLNKAISINPDYLNSYNVLGIIQKTLNKPFEAIQYYQKILEVTPNDPFVNNNLGNALNMCGRYVEAISAFHKAIQFRRAYAEAYSNLGKAHSNLGQLKEAEENFKKALEINPNNALFVLNIGLNLHDRGDCVEASEYYKKAVELDAKSPAQGYLLLLMNYSTHFSKEEVFKQHVAWQNKVRALLPSKRPEPRRKLNIKNRRIRIAYISPDFRAHSVSRFFEPLLFNHDTDKYEVFCYYNYDLSDNVTLKLKQQAEHWRNIYPLDDIDVVTRIMNDGIDILVDLAGHTGNNRVSVFAYRPAPIQITWLGYPNTTGLSEMDYRFTDEHTDPVGIADPFYTEKLIRLPHGFLCYQGNPELDFERALPFSKNGVITFGSFNNLTKVTDEVLEAWSKILLAIPGSGLLLKCKQLADEETRERVVSYFKSQGIESNRIALFAVISDVNEHLALYGKVDVGLDPFPYNGTTTTMEALWMGVPTITLAGDRHAGRVGASIMSSVGLEKFISYDVPSYIQLAIELADQVDYLSDVRSTLRERTMNSDLCNATQFTQDIEAVYDSLVKQHSNT